MRGLPWNDETGIWKGRPSATHCSEARNVTCNHIVFQIIGPPRCADDHNKHKHSVQLLTCVFKVACLLDLGLVLSLPVVRREPTTPPRFWVSRRVRRSCCPTAPRISAHVAICRGLYVFVAGHPKVTLFSTPCHCTVVVTSSSCAGACCFVDGHPVHKTMHPWLLWWFLSDCCDSTLAVAHTLDGA